jgi:hypothetical protein
VITEAAQCHHALKSKSQTHSTVTLRGPLAESQLNIFESGLTPMEEFLA